MRCMAGTPMSPFLANVYLTEMDKYFEERDVLYFRYSDDIILFADSMEELLAAEKRGSGEKAYLTTDAGLKEIGTWGEMIRIAKEC